MADDISGMLSDDDIEAATDEVLELAESRKPQWPNNPGRRRGTVVLDSVTQEPIELARLSSDEWSERVVAKALASKLGR